MKVPEFEMGTGHRHGRDDTVRLRELLEVCSELEEAGNNVPAICKASQRVQAMLRSIYVEMQIKPAKDFDWEGTCSTCGGSGKTYHLKQAPSEPSGRYIGPIGVQR